MADLGSDIAGALDLDPGLRVVSGRRALADAIVRRLTNQRGVFPDWPDYGFDLQSVVGTTLNLSQVRQLILEQCLLEEEVESATATLEQRGETLVATISVSDGAGPFDLTISVSDVSTEAIIPPGL